jgi:hypothetical protein
VGGWFCEEIGVERGDVVLEAVGDDRLSREQPGEGFEPCSGSNEGEERRVFYRTFTQRNFWVGQFGLLQRMESKLMVSDTGAIA